ncbi:UDP-glucosyl transferase 85A2 [Hibiscus syriacus]|uniref:UDP-glucosyl transferase 85A2 n=1 Tax=Hibiscus syriacus TaxID=106335 RepID=A0A6A2ZMK1_HIBSY|nr:UDP-glucosyl transferase 85A2 [Hibiscus syriacus]
MMQLTKLLHSRGFHITFVNSEFNHRRLIRSRGVEAVKGLPDFKFETDAGGSETDDVELSGYTLMALRYHELADQRKGRKTIPDGLPPSGAGATQLVPELSDSTPKNCFTPFLELLSKLNSSPQEPFTCIVSDGIMNFGTKAAQLIGVPYVQLWTSSTVSFMVYLQYKEIVKTDIIQFQDEHFVSDETLEMSIDIPGM